MLVMSESSKVSEQIEGRENRKGLQRDTRNREERRRRKIIQRK